jgi:hypothetical protein
MTSQNNFPIATIACWALPARASTLRFPHIDDTERIVLTRKFHLPAMIMKPFLFIIILELYNNKQDGAERNGTTITSSGVDDVRLHLKRVRRHDWSCAMGEQRWERSEKMVSLTHFPHCNFSSRWNFLCFPFFTLIFQLNCFISGEGVVNSDTISFLITFFYESFVITNFSLSLKSLSKSSRFWCLCESRAGLLATFVCLIDLKFGSVRLIHTECSKIFNFADHYFSHSSAPMVSQNGKWGEDQKFCLEWAAT